MCVYNFHLICALILNINYRKLYWTDEGGYGVPSKIGKVNMNGSNPVVLKEVDRPEAITIDYDKQLIYFSSQYPGSVSLLNTSHALLFP